MLVCQAKGFFTIEVRQKDSLLSMSAKRICLLLRSAKWFFTIEVLQKDFLLCMSAKSICLSKKVDKRILYYACPPKGFVYYWARPKDSLLMSGKRILYYSCSPTRFVYYWGQQKDSLLFMSAKRILYYSCPPTRLVYYWGRPKDSILLRSAKTIVYYWSPLKGFLTIHVLTDRFMVWLQVSLGFARWLNKTKKNTQTGLKNLSVLIINSLVSEHFLGSTRGGPLRVAGSE